jgi:hypothetical protein
MNTLAKLSPAAKLYFPADSEAFDIAIGTLAAALDTLPAIIMLRLSIGERIEYRGWTYAKG